MYFAGDVGGQLGLFLGANIVTVFEFIDYYARFFWYKFIAIYLKKLFSPKNPIKVWWNKLFNFAWFSKYSTETYKEKTSFAEWNTCEFSSRCFINCKNKFSNMQPLNCDSFIDLKNFNICWFLNCEHLCSLCLTSPNFHQTHKRCCEVCVYGKLMVQWILSPHKKGVLGSVRSLLFDYLTDMMRQRNIIWLVIFMYCKNAGIFRDVSWLFFS